MLGGWSYTTNAKAKAVSLTHSLTRDAALVARSQASSCALSKHPLSLSLNARGGVGLYYSLSLWLIYCASLGMSRISEALVERPYAHEIRPSLEEFNVFRTAKREIIK
jgi:hypothetical protein